MKIIATEDDEQRDVSNRDRLAVCPVCGQKLFEVVSIFNRGVFRLKCRRCRKYIKVSASNDNSAVEQW